MTGNVILFRKRALKEAFIAGQKAALADPSNLREVFEAGEKKGSGFLNEAINAPNFSEFMNSRRMSSPGSFSSWLSQNENRLGTPIDREQYEIAATEKSIEIQSGKKLITLDAIEEVIKHILMVSIDELRYNRRRYDIIKKPRYFAYYLAYHHCHATLREIGERWGGKNHATVLHGASCTYSDASLYDEDRVTLKLLYRNLAKADYNIEHFVQDDDMPNRSGCNRTKVKRVNLEP